MKTFGSSIAGMLLAVFVAAAAAIGGARPPSADAARRSPAPLTALLLGAIVRDEQGHARERLAELVRLDSTTLQPVGPRLTVHLAPFLLRDDVRVRKGLWAFSPNGRRLALNTGRGELLFVDLGAMRVVASLHRSIASPIAWPHGRAVTVLSNDRVLTIDPADGRVTRDNEAAPSGFATENPEAVATSSGLAVATDAGPSSPYSITAVRPGSRTAHIRLRRLWREPADHYDSSVGADRALGLARADLARRLGVSASRIRRYAVVERMWPTGNCGWGNITIVDYGYQVILAARRSRFEYRVTTRPEGSAPRLCSQVVVHRGLVSPWERARSRPAYASSVVVAAGAGDRGVVVLGSDGTFAAVDLRSRRVRYRKTGVRFRGPAAVARAGTLIAVAGADPGVIGLDTRTLRTRTLRLGSCSLSAGHGLLLTYSSAPTCTGLVGFAPNGARRLALLRGESLDRVGIAGRYAYVRTSDEHTIYVIDLDRRVVVNRARSGVEIEILLPGRPA